MSYFYQAFGLSIQSDIALPPLFEKPSVKTPDIQVVLADVSETGLEQADMVKPFSQFNQTQLWLNIIDVARFEVTANLIKVDPLSEDWDSIRLFLLGSCFGAIMHLKQDLVLHGNTIKFGDECAVFMGPSGNGKSTLASAFYKKGYQILADDLARVDETLCVQPSYPQLKLWEDSARKLEIDTSVLKRIRPQNAKFAVPIQDSFFNQPLPVKALYILNTHNQDDFIFEELSGVNKFQPLKNNTFRPHFTQAFGMQKVHLKRVSQLANQARVVRITRPNYGFQIDELVKRIEQDLQQAVTDE